MLIRFLATRAGDRKPTTRSYSCSCSRRSSTAGALGSRRAGESGHSEKLRNEQVQIEIENASELKKFPLEVSHGGLSSGGMSPASGPLEEFHEKALGFNDVLGSRGLSLNQGASFSHRSA